MPLQAVLFDLDDTLHDKSATLRRVGARQFEAHDLASLGVSRESWLARYLVLNNQRIEKTQVFSTLGAEFGLSSALATTLLEEFDAQLGSQAVAYPGALELLVWCRQKALRTGIVTNGRDAFQRSKVAGMGIEHLGPVNTNCAKALFERQ
jgi:putative hydrolase of the HAD superfamily